MIASGPFLTSHVLKLEQKAQRNTAVWLGEREMRTNICLPTWDTEKKFMGTLQCVSYMFYYTNLYCFSTIWQVFRTGLACPDTPSSWPVRTWLLLPLARCILAQCAWVSYCDFKHKAHCLGQSKRGSCFLLCIVSLLDSFWCQVVTLRNDSGEWDGGESLVFMSALFSFCGEQNYTGNYERLVIC